MVETNVKLMVYSYLKSVKLMVYPHSIKVKLVVYSILMRVKLMIYSHLMTVIVNLVIYPHLANECKADVYRQSCVQMVDPFFVQPVFVQSLSSNPNLT